MNRTLVGVIRGVTRCSLCQSCSIVTEKKVEVPNYYELQYIQLNFKLTRVSNFCYIIWVEVQFENGASSKIQKECRCLKNVQNI